ncbi:MAG: TIR domain-containing protein [Anaerolineae bacterium]
MPDLFVSYSRKDKEFVKKLVEALKAQNRDIWVDWEDIPLTADWLNEIFHGIEGSNNFVFIISPDSVASEVCGQELTRALEMNKRLVPILYREVSDYKLMHGALSSHNWIYMRDNDSFDDSLKGLASALDTDLEYVKAHTRMLERAREWTNKNHNTSFLLRGDDLQDGEKWLSQSAGKKPSANELQSNYIFESRSAETRRQRTLLTSVALALAISLVLLVYAVYQTIQARQNAERADRNAEFALARQLAAQSAVNLNSELDLALLLSLQANRIADDTGLGGGEVRGTLVDALQYSPQLSTYLHGNYTAAKGISLSPDGTLLASAHINGEVVITDMQTHEVIAVIPTESAVRRDTVSFSPDGQVLAVGGYDMMVSLWDMSDPRNPQLMGAPLAGHENRLVNVLFASQGNTLVSASVDGKVIFWDVSDPTTPTQLGSFLSTGDADLRDTALTADGHWLIVGAGDSSMYLWDVSDPAAASLVRQIQGHAGAVETVAFSPDGSLIASGADDHDVFVWDTATATDETTTDIEPIARLRGHTNIVVEVAFSPDASILASSGADEAIFVWPMSAVLNNTVDVRSVPRLIGHSNWINGLIFTSDGQTLISSGDDGNIIIWDIHRRQQLGDTLEGHTDEVLGVAYSPDGNLIASGSLDHSIILWDAHTHQQIGEPLTGPDGQIESVAFSPDSHTVVATSNDLENQLILWDVSDPANPQRIGVPLNGHTQGPLAAVFSPDGTMLASTGSDSSIILWDVSNLEAPTQLATLTGHTGFVKGLAFSPDGTLLASSGRDRRIVFWDVNRDSETFGQMSGEPLTGHDRSIMTIAFSPDGQRLASGSLDETVRLWDVQTRQPLFEPIHSHTWFIYSIAFSPDGRLLASASADETIILMDVATNQQIGRPLQGPTDSVRGVAFSPDSRYLVSGSEDHTVVIWDVAFDAWTTRACHLVNRNLTQFEWQEFVGEDTAPLICPDVAAAVPAADATP